ncbi:diacylglycerol kinase family lipid kinase [Peptoniphilus equinus]|uniref:Diacylglycerol kinase family lipid kinase n=1 Tax=Peptoniphilus equinus TaxID=3016343 RepID=A0ABY7QTR2_9FIRM|nr:diacylglycerol kinase family protein [Peptoniphilus equinus]WBW50182.1 diacylglycerol kinase family lipid kinase [Peptoniphilus equinus]
MTKALIVYNPNAGKEEGEAIANRFKGTLQSHFETVELKGTQKAHDATDFAAASYDDGFEAVFAIGGDGTVNEVVQGLLEIAPEHRPTLGVIPGGTFNAVTRVLDTVQDTDAAIDAYTLDFPEAMDIGRANDNIFCLIFSIGNIPEGIHNSSSEEKTKFAFLAYAKNILTNMTKQDTYNLTITADGKDYSGTYSHVVVLLSGELENQEFTKANIQKDDGYLHMMLLNQVSFLEGLNLIPDIAAGVMDDNENVHYIKAKSITIDSADGTEIETDLDGDKGDHLPVNLSVDPLAITAFTQKAHDDTVQ